MPSIKQLFTRNNSEEYDMNISVNIMKSVIYKKKHNRSSSSLGSQRTKLLWTTLVHHGVSFSLFCRHTE